MALGYLKPLDGVRSLAILLVLVWHYFTSQIDPVLFGGLANKLIFLTAWTWSGVDLFFVLSGFLIGRILIHHRSSNNYFSTFYARRVFRIFPPYYLVVAVLFLIIAFGAADKLPWLTHDPLPAWTYLAYLQNFWMASEGFGPHWLGVTWSLAIEEQFYLILPLVIYLLPPKHLPKVLIAGILMAPVFRMLLPGLGPYVLLPARMDALLLGVLIAHYHLSGDLTTKLAGKRPLLGWTVVLLFIVMIGYIYITKESIGGVVIHTILALLYAVMVTWVLLTKTGSPAQRFLSSGPLAFLARISYMMYLTHQIFSGLFHRLLLDQTPQIHNLQDALVTTLSLAATIGFSALSYTYFEKPILRLGKNYGYT